MGVPTGFIVRVQRLADQLPYPITVYMPPARPDEEPKTNPRLSGPELDIVVPVGDEPHILLGRFLDAWSRLEATITKTLKLLLQSDIETARYVQSITSVRQLMDLLTAFASLKMEDPLKNDFVTIFERFRKLNGKRNTLVHGRWELHAAVFVSRKVAYIRSQFVRLLPPTDPEIEKLMMDPKNQKERVKHVFNLKRIEGATRDTEVLILDVEKIQQGFRMSPTWIEKCKERLSESEKLDLLWSTYRIDPLRATRVIYGPLP